MKDLFVREVSPEGREGGTGHPLLFVHGGLHGWWAWEKWQPRLAEAGWRTFALSLPGHAGSAALSDRELAALTLRDYADAVTAVADWLPERPVLVGHSMGGIVAQLVAQDAGACRPLPALVLVASGRMRADRPFRPDYPPDTPVTIDYEQARAFFHDVDDATLGRVYDRLTAESPCALNDYTRGGVIEQPRFLCPVLALTAEHDGATANEAADYATQSYRATRASVLGAGHDLILEPAGERAADFLHAWLLTHIPAAIPGIRVLAP